MIVRRYHQIAAAISTFATITHTASLPPTASPEELLLALPERTWSAIRGTRKSLKLPGRWTRWEPCILPAWAEHGYCAADVVMLERYELPLDCPKLVEISSSSSITETRTSLHPYI